MQLTPESIRVSLRLQPAFLAELDDHRRQLEDLPNRAEAIRRLLEQALASTNHKPRGRQAQRKNAR